jgi:uncharacterized protein (DUF4415 family)
MTKQKSSQEFVNGRGYTEQDWDGVSDNAELSDIERSQMRPFSEVFPELDAAIRKGRGKQKLPTKQQVTLRLDRHIIEAFKAKGAGWQNQINEALKFNLKQ